MPDTPEPVDAEQGTTNSDDFPRRPRSVLPSFLFISFVLFMITNNQGEEITARNQYLEALAGITQQIANYSGWLNGTSSENFTLPEQDPVTLPLVESFVTFGAQLDPLSASYYTNLTGFWRGDIAVHNLTSLESNATSPPPHWHTLADSLISNANLTNATELTRRLGNWNWSRSDKVAISFGDKLVWFEAGSREVSKDIAMVHGKIDFTDPESAEELRLEVDGVHFVSNGSIYAFAEPSGHGVDLRNIPMLVPPARMNETAHVILGEMLSRTSKLKEKVETGTIEETAEDDSIKTECSFQLFAQVQRSDVSQRQLQELEDEIDEPTGITTVRPPEMKLRAVLISKNCGILYELPGLEGMKSQTLFRKITSYAGLATIVNLIMLLLHTRQVARSRTAAGLSRVSRYPFIIQSLTDAVSFVGHVTLAILAEGRTSLAVLAPAGLACILFVQEAQFAIIIGQIQAPEDIRPPPPRPAPAPATPTPTATSTPNPATNGDDGAATGATLPTVTTTPASPPRPGLFRYLFDHIRSDPSARLWFIISFFLLVVFRLVIALSLPLLFVGILYTSMWTLQIYRAARRGRASGLASEYLFGVTACRLYYLLYFLACPKNILDVESRPWVYGVALCMLLQAAVILMQGYFSPAFFLPGGVAKVETYDYHPPMPLPDAEAPEQSLGDCAICMDAITLDPALRQHVDEKSDMPSIARRTGGLLAQNARQSYSLAPCHHLFHTACLERWLAIKNICPQCRRPLPPL